MSARRSSQPSVQLFPFLAVLMCALGALILLLLVVTSRMRDQARIRASQAQQVEATPVKSQAPRARPPERERWQPATTPPVAKLEPSATSPPNLPPPPADILRDKWRRTVMDLQAAAAAEEAALRQLENAMRADEAAERELSEELKQLRSTAGALAEQRAVADSERERDARRLVDLQMALAQQSSALEQLRSARQAAASKYTLLPYDGRSGTTRRPIYVECTATGITFAAERITLTPQQLDGFPAVRNPLLAGADALIDYWSLQGLKNPADPGGQPYVLLIVRPQGTIAYYVARRMLDGLGTQFGYELVPEDLMLEWPAPDPAAAAACRAAIEAALHQRNNPLVRGYVPPGSLEPLSVSNGSGTFALEEVERLRGDGRKVHFGGRAHERSGGAGEPRRAEAVQRAGEPSAAGRAAENRAAAGPPDAIRSAQSAGAIVPENRETPPDQVAPRAPASAGAPSPEAIAANAANSFSAAAGRRSQSPTDSAAPGRGTVADNTPRPLSATDASGTGSLTTGRSVARNPAAVLRDPGSQIGLERKVTIRIEPQRIVVESESPIIVGPEMSREDLQSQFAATLRGHFEGWGRPPRSFYWLPQVRFIVLPGGHANLKRLADLTREWEMASQIDYALE